MKHKFHIDNKMHETRIYLDCDGVLADFDTHFETQVGQRGEHYETEHGSEKFWEMIQTGFDRFFFHLPKILDADDLVNTLKSYNIRPIILTGCPRGDWSRIQKLRWGEKNFPGIPMITCMSRNKKDYCMPGDILIDDTLKHKQLWLDAGGIFIHHTSAADSIKQLEELDVINK